MKKSSEIFSQILVGLATFAVAVGIRGDWIFILVQIYKQLTTLDNPSDQHLSQLNGTTEQPHWHGKLQNLPFYLLFANLVSFGVLYSLSGYLHWIYYVKRRGEPEKWKCQPDKFLTPENEWHEIYAGSRNILIGSLISGTLACYIMNGGKTMLYYKFDEYGYLYLLLISPVILFVWDEAIAFYTHRLFHEVIWLYKTFHKHHHRYHSPTAIAAVAMHPGEFVIYQTLLALPMFFIPFHAGVYVTILLYIYYYGLVDHSGINMDAIWPWQPPVMFHDRHHKYFHVNYGFNSLLFDWLHGTLYRPDRRYGEDIFGGKGAPLK